MDLHEKAMPAEERFKILMDKLQQEDQAGPGSTKIILPDGREVLADRVVAYVDMKGNTDKHSTLVAGRFSLQNLLDAKISLNREIDKHIRELVGPELSEKLKDAGLPGVKISVGLAAVPAEIIEKLKKQMANVKGYDSLTETQKAQLEAVYKRHMAAMGTEARQSYAVDKIKEVKWDARSRTVNIYFVNGDWWHYKADGTWY